VTKSSISEFTNVRTNDQIDTAEYCSIIADPMDNTQGRSSAPRRSQSISEIPVLKHDNAGKRIYFLDNLRSFMIFLVVMLHAGIVYESSGVCAVFWIVDDPLTNDLSGILNLVLDIFVMPTIFFISGYFAPLSLQKKSGLQFLKSKFKRLMVPWLIAVLTLIPMYKFIFLLSRDLPQEHWTTYFHFSNGIFSQSWLWFLPVLFGFNAFFVLLSNSRTMPRSIVSLRVAMIGTFVLGFGYSMGMDLLGWRGWSKIGVADFQNERLLLYLAVFMVGAVCFRQNVFERKPKTRILYHVLNLLVWIPLTAYVVFLLYPWLNPGLSIVSPGLDRIILWLSFMLSMFGTVYLMVQTFRFYLDKQGKLLSELNRNSYDVYIIHVVVIGILATLMLDWETSSLLKYLVLTLSTFVVCNVMISFCRWLVGSVAKRTKRAKLEAVS
jgi:fucose 4-O-acetylase-like acetyltransferase